MTARFTVERTTDGYRLVVFRKIDASAERVWALLVEPANWPAWGPSVTAVDCPATRIEAGTTGRVQIVGGIWLPFEVTACEDYRWTWKIGRITATGHRVFPIGPGRCRAAFEVPLLAVPYALVCWIALRRLDRLAGGD